MSTDDSITHLRFRLDTLLGLQMTQIDDLLSTYIEIKETKDKIEKAEIIKERTPTELDDK